MLCRDMPRTWNVPDDGAMMTPARFQAHGVFCRSVDLPRRQRLLGATAFSFDVAATATVKL